MSSGNFNKAKTLATIKDFNQVIFFLGVVLVFLAWVVAMASNMVRSPYVETGVQVLSDAQPKEEVAATVAYTKSFHRKIKDTYVFSVASYKTGPKASYGAGRAFEMRKGHGYSHGPTVNFIFVNPEAKSRRLFKSDSMIEHYEFANFHKSRGVLLDKSVYRVATQDTNSDGLINYEDQQSLYVSTYDGLGLQAVLEEVVSFQVIEDNTLLLSQSTPKGMIFHEYRVDTGILTALDTAM